MSPRFPFQVLGSKLILPGKVEHFPLRHGQAAFARGLAQPSGQLSVMRSGVVQAPIPVGDDGLQCGRVLTWHAHVFPEKSCSTLNEAGTRYVERQCKKGKKNKEV